NESFAIAGTPHAFLYAHDPADAEVYRDQLGAFRQSAHLWCRSARGDRRTPRAAPRSQESIRPAATAVLPRSQESYPDPDPENGRSQGSWPVIRPAARSRGRLLAAYRRRSQDCRRNGSRLGCRASALVIIPCPGGKHAVDLRGGPRLLEGAGREGTRHVRGRPGYLQPGPGRPAGATVTAGHSYDVWCQVQGNPEAPEEARGHSRCTGLGSMPGS